MQLLIQLPLAVTPEQVTAYLTNHNLKLPVFFDKTGHLVVDFNQRSRGHVFELINWLVTR